MEPCPKWTSLQEILQEVKKHNTESSLDTEAGRILIAAADHRTCQQIKQVKELIKIQYYVVQSSMSFTQLFTDFCLPGNVQKWSRGRGSRLLIYLF